MIGPARVYYIETKLLSSSDTEGSDGLSLWNQMVAQSSTPETEILKTRKPI
jgi:hypothetical protein